VLLCAASAAGHGPVPRLRQGEGQQTDGQVLRTVSHQWNYLGIVLNHDCGFGSGWILTFSSDPDSEILTGSGFDPLKMLSTYLSEKVIFFTSTFWKKNSELFVNGTGTFLKKGLSELISKLGEFLLP
jgi:hypothetical protein